MRDLRSFVQLVTGLPAFLRHPITLREARETLTRRLAQRDDNFLRSVEQGIFAHASSPYRPLLAWAQCELSDIRDMVRRKGVEATLRALRDAGVYVSFPEFKGREPMVRGGRAIPLKAADFFNPHADHHLRTTTGGTTGTGTPGSSSLSRIADLALYLAVAYDAYGVAAAPKALWRGTLPDSSGVASLLASARAGTVPQRWFTPVIPADLRTADRSPLHSPRRFSLATHAIVRIGRLSGVPLPWPEAVPLARADIVARWAADTVRRHGRCYITTSASMALRVCLTAKALSLDLTGTTFTGGGEPMTAAKAAGITSVGARTLQNYFSVDTGAMGMSCAAPGFVSEQHLLTDSVAFTQYPRQVPGTDLVVDAFNVTTLLPWSQKVLLNVELDDYGIIEERSCGCPFEHLGYTQHVRQIASYRKLTGEGVTLIGTDMVRILEEVLPARFGGTSLDYQLAEEEDTDGFTRVTLRVSPRIAIADEATVRDAVMESISQLGVGVDHGRALWHKAGTLRVTRAEPVWTGRGKMMPLHLAQRGRPAQTSSPEDHPVVEPRHS